MLGRFRGFIGPSYSLRAFPLDCQRSVNLYPEVDELGTGKEGEIAALVGTPGLRLLATLGAGPVRAAYTTSKGVLIVVSGNQVWRVSRTWAADLLGTIPSREGAVGISDNGTQIIVADGVQGFLWTEAGLWAPITSENYPNGTSVWFQDGYFLTIKPETGELWISGLYDGASWDGLDFSTAEGSPDPLVGGLSIHREAWLFGPRSTEVFYNSGSAGTTFARLDGAYIEYGCIAAGSIQKLANTVVWLGADNNGHGVILKAAQYQPARISNFAVEFALSQYGDLSGATAWTYSNGGHHFYCLQIPGADTTWVYDDALGIWHERTYWHPMKGQQKHRGACHAFAYGTNVVGDRENGNIYALETSALTDNTAAIRRERVSPHISKNRIRAQHRMLELDMQVGVGLDGTQQGSDPQVMLQWSNDYGRTWSNEHWMAAGKIGQTLQRVRWKQLGMGVDRVYRVVITDPTVTALVGAQLDVEPGRS